MKSACLVILLLGACRGPIADHGDDVPDPDAGIDLDAASPDASVDPDAEPVAPCDGTPAECGAMWEDAAVDAFDAVAGDHDALAAFLAGVPKGGDLHQHLNGAVYAETYLAWGDEDGNCINPTTYAAGSASTCSSGNVPIPDPGTFYDQIVRAWSMKDFVEGTESGHDHFFATFGKYGTIAGLHRDESIADVATRAADENQLYVETMFNLGKNVGSLAASLWSGAVTADQLQAFYDLIIGNAGFATELQQDLDVVGYASTGWRNLLACDGASPPAACDVTVRFIAQVSRTGANDQIFGQLVSAFEMAKSSGQIVAANLSSPEDDGGAIANYDLHMAMLDFLHDKYAGVSPLHITLHAGELVPEYLPQGSTANTFHIRAAVDVGHAERIGHGIDIMSETAPDDLLADMAAAGVLVEVCLSSNEQILEVSGTDHPLAAYLEAGVPVALATDDQGVSRSSLAGEMLRAVEDQQLDYRQLKRLARNSLEHAFLPGESLWTSLASAQPVAACAPTATMGVGDPPDATCEAFLATSERARLQWELEHRFRVFERAQL